MWASGKGADNVIAVFMRHNVDIQQMDKMAAQVCQSIRVVEGLTAFMWASGKGADNVIAVFMRHNVDIQQVDKNGGSGM